MKLDRTIFFRLYSLLHMCNLPYPNASNREKYNGKPNEKALLFSYQAKQKQKHRKFAQFCDG